MGFKHGDVKKYHAKFIDDKTKEVIEEGNYSSFRKIDNRLWELIFTQKKLIKVVVTLATVLLLVLLVRNWLVI